MYIVTEAYDDNTANILSINDFSGEFENRIFMTERQLINFASHKDCLGLSTSEHKINYINSYNCIVFPSENEANEYITSSSTASKKKCIGGMYFVFERKNIVKHVSYFICTFRGEQVSYVAPGKREYTPYIQSAQEFSKIAAQKKAYNMTQKSKTGTHWTTQRVVN